MPLKERSGKLLREFININYKVINSHYRIKEAIYNGNVTEKVTILKESCVQTVRDIGSAF